MLKLHRILSQKGSMCQIGAVASASLPVTYTPKKLLQGCTLGCPNLLERWKLLQDQFGFPKISFQ
jgi:hypothetical protein